MLPQQTGQTTICKWKDDKVAAFSVGGDDSLRSPLDFAIPEMDKRGLRGTWWVNPGRGGSRNFKKQDDAWANGWIARYDDWKAAAARGHDFANHTMHHLGATDYQAAVGKRAALGWPHPPTVLEVTERRIGLALQSTTNPKLYDYPLTLKTTTGQFVLEIDSNPTVLAPTVLYVPRQHYPTGPEVAITSGQVEYQPAEQCLLWHSAEPGHQTLTLRRP